ncbi:MAG: peptide chain release factor N(5)-glutamine methyltransferase [Oscillospiraceae bacterium]|jgi:release factor glutamine methyltransferase|nr:peptide chain release factor N(5)-glutamine methyltransferase [Oscillospiraceae bacterium]
MQTYGDILIETRRALRGAGIDAAELEARIIVEHSARLSRAEFEQKRGKFPPDGKFERAVLANLARRLAGEPLAYITGEWEFYSLPIYVTRDTLIPRADTERLAERAITLLRGVDNPRVLDLCCGSGCVGLAIAANLRGAHVILVDAYTAALDVARRNVQRLGFARRVSCVETDALASPPALGTFDMIVCNPPYIESDEIPTLDASVRDFEPHTALDGGTDGLAFYRAITEKWSVLLAPRGRLVFEVGMGQSLAVAAILGDCGFKDVSVTRDYNGIERVVDGTR